MIYEFKDWLHPRDRLGRFREVLGSLKPGDGVRTQNAIVSRRRGGTFRVAPRGKRPVDTRSVDFAARAGLTGLTGSQEMTPAQKKKQTERVKDSLLRTVDKPAKGPYTPGMEPTMRVAASPGTIATPSAAEYKDYEAFMNRLDSHDWFYSMSDSQGVWRAGEMASADLAKEADSDPIKAAMYADYKRHKFTGPAWGNEKEPKPELSNYVSAPEDTSPIQSGDRVIDPDSGRTGTYQMSRMAGTPSIRWDDDPDSVEVYYEGALEKLPEPPRSPGTDAALQKVMDLPMLATITVGDGQDARSWTKVPYDFEPEGYVFAGSSNGDLNQREMAGKESNILSAKEMAAEIGTQSVTPGGRPQSMTGSAIDDVPGGGMTDRQFMRDGVKFQIIGVREVNGKKMFVAVDAEGNEILRPRTDLF